MKRGEVAKVRMDTSVQCSSGHDNHFTQFNSLLRLLPSISLMGPQIPVGQPTTSPGHI